MRTRRQRLRLVETSFFPAADEVASAASLLPADLCSYDDVSAHADAILGQLQAGTMPCDGAWPADQVALFARWVETGKPE